MTLGYDLYWSFRSPYSYLVTPRLVELERDYDVAANVRPVYPIAIRQPDFFANNDPLWLSYFMRDIGRSAEFVGLPFRWASPDPVAMDHATRSYPKEQPLARRLTHLGIAAAERGRGLAFLDEVSRVIWGGAVTDWHLATISPAPPSAPDSTLRKWTQRLRLTGRTMSRSSKQIRTRSALADIMACR